MSRPGLLLSLLLGALALLPTSGAAGEHVPPEDNFVFAPALALAGFQAQRGQYGDVLQTLEPAMRDDAYAQIPPKHAYRLAKLYSMAAYDLGDWEASHRAIRLAMRQPQATIEDWDLRFDAAVMAGDGADAFLAFQRLSGRAPLQGFTERQLVRFDRLLGTLPNAREARLALGRELEREDWQTPFVFYDPSRVWLDYAEALQQSGDVVRARTTVMKITDPTVIMAMQADKRFDALVAATPSLQDAHRAAERNLGWARDYVRDNPRMLSGRIALARALDLLDRPTEALPVLDDATRAAGGGPRREPAFDDVVEERVLQYWRNAVLIRVGRTDEAIGAGAAAAACHCSSLDAVFLAQALLDAGRPDEAQRWLDDLSENGLSLEDRMVLAQTRVCAAAERGKEATEALAFLARHETWAPEAKINALICTGDFSAAADAVTRQLADPQMRLDALAGLQAYAPEPGPRKHVAKLRAGWSRLAEMPNVQAAVARIGRIKAFDLQRRGPFG